tara:strand:- start:82 stop:606 length:525 start_codon:yes stop_codon:yes gene_type:complete
MSRRHKGVRGELDMGRSKKIQTLNREGEYHEMWVNPRMWEEVKNLASKGQEKNRLCKGAIRLELSVKVFSFLPVRERTGSRLQCGREVEGLSRCRPCHEYRLALFALWGEQKLMRAEKKEKEEREKEEKREIASPDEMERYFRGDFLSEGELDKLTDPRDTVFAHAFRKLEASL